MRWHQASVSKMAEKTLPNAWRSSLCVDDRAASTSTSYRYDIDAFLLTLTLVFIHHYRIPPNEPKIKSLRGLGQVGRLVLFCQPLRLLFDLGATFYAVHIPTAGAGRAGRRPAQVPLASRYHNLSPNWAGAESIPQRTEEGLQGNLILGVAGRTVASLLIELSRSPWCRKIEVTYEASTEPFPVVGAR